MPVKFEIYRNGARLTAFEPVAAMAIGPESVPVPGEILFRDGLLIVNRKDDHAVGIALLWDVGPLGSFILETTRLQPREKPYVLNVELARFRLMKIVQKQEDWNLFDFPKFEKFLQKLHEGQMLFAETLGKLHDPAVAAGLADRALEMAIDLSEQLATFHTDLLLNRRKQTNGFVKHVFGCRIDPQVNNERYREMVATQFDYAVVPMSWKEVQPQEQSFNPAPVDEWVEFLSKRRVPTIAGPLVRLDSQNVPDWMVIWEHDFDMLREMAYDYVQKMVTRYRKAVAVWNVVAGIQSNTAFSLSFEQIIELTRLLVSQVKTLLPGARTLVTITHPFGEYHARGRGGAPAGVPPMLYAEMLANAGIAFEAFGLEIELGVPTTGNFNRDLFQMSCALDKFATLGKPVFITAIGVPGRHNADPGDVTGGRLNPDQAGRWHRPWDPQLQAEWMDAVYQMALSKPFVEAIAWNNLTDVKPSLPGGGLLDDMLQPKAAFTKLQQLREKFRPPPVQVPTAHGAPAQPATPPTPPPLPRK
ncbi:endo-1,4-beta-xylanase [Humisphaera borealis]|uniref:endo-1,4-beta-xylanase n=1 Tax=Humisphaera borealis TaxID=2807512 RepID=A0A7M2WS98_9BACT|nr:endo-1,4-beta-xylanase [Humisphaera borealis]QOV88313.1 endo-1,4-beta-xylanase [Humisphaera borealis]